MKDVNNAIDSKKSWWIEWVVDTIIFVASAVIAKAMSTKIQVWWLIWAILLFLAILIPLRLIAWTISRLIWKVSKIQWYKNWLKFLWYFILTWIWIILLIVTIAPLFDTYLSSFQNEQSSWSTVINNEINNNSWNQNEYDFKWIKVKQPHDFILIDETVVWKSLSARWNNPLIFAHPDGLFFRVNVIEDIWKVADSLLDQEIKILLRTDLVKNNTIDFIKLKEYEKTANEIADYEWWSIQWFTCSRKLYVSKNNINFLMCWYERLKSWKPVSYRIVYSNIDDNKLIWATVWVIYENTNKSKTQEMIDKAWTIADDLIDWITLANKWQQVSAPPSLPKQSTINTKDKKIDSQVKPIIQTESQPIVKDTCDIAINKLTESHSNNSWIPTSDYSYCIQLADQDWSINKQPSKPCHKLCEKYRSRQYIHDRKCAMWDPYEKCD